MADTNTDAGGTTTPKTKAAGATSNTLLGCDFDIATARALNGKTVVALVTNKDGDDLLAIAGQQGLSYNMSAETTEASTKDGSNGGWTLKFHGTKSWDASIDGLYSPDDEAAKLVAKAMENDEYLCLKICERTAVENGVKYTPLRMGLAIVTSDNFEAPNDDNMTYSMDFDGCGKPWLRETATAAEIEAATFTVTTSA